MEQEPKASARGAGVTAAEVESMRRRLELMEAENARLRASSNGALTFKVLPKGELLKNGQTRSAAVLQVSGGSIGYPQGHTPEKWLRIAENMDAIVGHIVERKLA